MGGGRRKRKDRLPSTEAANEFEQQIMDEMDKSYFRSIHKLSSYLATKRDAWADYLWPHPIPHIDPTILILVITAILLLWLARK